MDHQTQKRQFIFFPGQFSKTFKVISLLIITLALPLTVYFAQQRQQTRQSASTPLTYPPVVTPTATPSTIGWYNTSWNYRNSINITNNSVSETLTDHQIHIALPADFTFSLIQASGQDLRFTDSNGSSILNHWIENYDPITKTASIWIKIPQINPAPTKTIYMYYGNSNAPNTSNGKGTFDFFDDFNSPSWSVLPDIPITTADETAAVTNGKIYIIGGYNNTANDPLATVLEFDPLTNSYRTKRSMPTPRWGPIAIPLNGKVHVFGGENTNGGVKAHEVYSPLTDSWDTTKAPLPLEISNQGITGCTNGTNIYLFYGGLGYSYNPLTNSYQKLADIKIPITSWATCAYHNGKIYLIGGYYSGAKDYTQIYNIATNTWSQGAPIPFAFYGAIRENPIIGDKIYIVQGQREIGEFSSKVYVYDIPKNIWTEKSFGPHAADGVAGGIIDGKIYTFGGRQDTTGPHGLHYAARYTPTLDTEELAWTQLGGNFEMRNGKLTVNNPPSGGLLSNFTQIQTTRYQTTGNFVLQTKAEIKHKGGGYNGIAFHTNAGRYGSTLNGYIAPYNDFGTSYANFYKETGESFDNLYATTDMSTGVYDFTVVSSQNRIDVLRNNKPYLTTTDTTYRNGYINIIDVFPNITDFYYIFVRKYSPQEPSLTIGEKEAFISPTPTQDLTPPLIIIDSPLPNASYTKTGTITMTASVSDPSGVTRVEFLDNNLLRCTDTAIPYSCTWAFRDKIATTHSLQVKATDTKGNTAFTIMTVKTL